MSEPKPLMESALLKLKSSHPKIPFASRWNKRYFSVEATTTDEHGEMHAADMAVCYYNSKHEVGQEPAGWFYVHMITEVRPSPFWKSTLTKFESAKKYMYGFQVTTPSRTYHFRAKTEANRDMWVYGLSSIAGLPANAECKWPITMGQPPETKMYGAGHGLSKATKSSSAGHSHTFRGRHDDDDDEHREELEEEDRKPSTTAARRQGQRRNNAEEESEEESEEEEESAEEEEEEEESEEDALEETEDLSSEFNFAVPSSTARGGRSKKSGRKAAEHTPVKFNKNLDAKSRDHAHDAIRTWGADGAAANRQGKLQGRRKKKEIETIDVHAYGDSSDEDKWGESARGSRQTKEAFIGLDELEDDLEELDDEPPTRPPRPARPPKPAKGVQSLIEHAIKSKRDESSDSEQDGEGISESTNNMLESLDRKLNLHDRDSPQLKDSFDLGTLQNDDFAPIQSSSDRHNRAGGQKSQDRSLSPPPQRVVEKTNRRKSKKGPRPPPSSVEGKYEDEAGEKEEEPKKAGDGKKKKKKKKDKKKPQPPKVPRPPPTPTDAAQVLTDANWLGDHFDSSSDEGRGKPVGKKGSDRKKKAKKKDDAPQSPYEGKMDDESLRTKAGVEVDDDFAEAAWDESSMEVSRG